MALSPAEARARKTELSKDEFKAICDRIDKMLLGEPNGSSEHWMNISVLQYLHQKPIPDLVKRVISTYQGMGWKVRFEADSRDGDALVFSE